MVLYMLNYHRRADDVAIIGKYGIISKEKPQKKKKMSFLKIPKSGSSTVACIFLRFGVNNNLSMYLPRKSRIFDAEQYDLMQQNKHYDIFVIHTNYNYRFFTSIVQNPAIIGIVRRPEIRIISHVIFFNIGKRYEYLKGLSRQSIVDNIVLDTEQYHLNKIMSSYFGINNLNMSESSIEKYLSKLNSEFTLVLILERLDESLILLKRLLNWSVFDVIYAAKKTLNNDDIHLNTSQIAHLKSTNMLEYAIYNYFYTELETKIKNAKNDFEQEVANFQDILYQCSVFCNMKNKTMSYYKFPASRWDESFLITKKDCDLIYRADVSTFKKNARRNAV